MREWRTISLSDLSGQVGFTQILENTSLNYIVLKRLFMCLMAAIRTVSLVKRDYCIKQCLCVELSSRDQLSERHRIVKCGLGPQGVHAVVGGTPKTRLFSCLLASNLWPSS